MLSELVMALGSTSEPRLPPPVAFLCVDFEAAPQEPHAEGRDGEAMGPIGEITARIAEASRLTRTHAGQAVLVVTPAYFELLEPLLRSEHGITLEPQALCPLFSEPDFLEFMRRPLADRRVASFLDKQPRSWRQNPGLIVRLIPELLRVRPGRADYEEGLTAALAGFLRRNKLSDADSYLSRVFDQGLSDQQRDVLRDIAAGLPPSRPRPAWTRALRLLQLAGLVSQTEPPEIIDPVLRHHLPSPLIIHHISDVHFGHLHQGSVATHVHEPDKAYLAKALGPEDLRANQYVAWLKDKGTSASTPHMVLVSGDLTEWCTNDELASARAWLNELHELLQRQEHPGLRPTDPRLLVVGGNHDVRRADAEPDASAAKRHQPFADAMSGSDPSGPALPHPNLHLAPTAPERLKLVHFEDLSLTVLLLGSSELGQERELPGALKLTQGAWKLLKAAQRDALKAGKEYHDLSELLKAAEGAAGGMPDPKKLKKHRVRYEQLSRALNVADPALIHEKVLARIEAEPLGRQGQLNVAMLHHPISPILGDESYAPYPGLLNASRVKHQLFKKRFQLVLHGHQHTPQRMTETWHEIVEQDALPLHIVSAPSLGSTQITDRLNGFVELTFLVEGGACRAIRYQRYRAEKASWEPDGKPAHIPLVHT